MLLENDFLLLENDFLLLENDFLLLENDFLLLESAKSEGIRGKYLNSYPLSLIPCTFSKQ